MIENSQKIILVAGVSSSGKSTFIKNLVPTLLESDPSLKIEDIDIIFAKELRNNFNLGKKKCLIIHYNSLIPFDIDAELKTIDYNKEPIIKKISNLKIEEIFICYAPDNIIEKRMTKRHYSEPLYNKFTIYPSNKILNSFKKINQRKLVIDISKQFNSQSKNIFIVFSQNETSMILPIKYFTHGVHSEFLETVLKDSICTKNLIELHKKKFSSLAYNCAIKLSQVKEYPNPFESIELKKNDKKKQSRNDPCFCGSGQKYKHCHGKLN